MTDETKDYLDSIEPILGRVPYAITLSDLTLPDQPLIYMNRQFFEMTGCDANYLGRNCRFLQSDFDNEDSRAEVRRALSAGERTQVVLQNRRMTGEAFYNMLYIQSLGPVGPVSNLAMGAQFELAETEALTVLRDAKATKMWGIRTRSVLDHGLRIRLEQRRTVMESTIRVLKSWDVMHRIKTGTLLKG